MDGVLAFLCVALIVLAVVTVVGHGIWVAIAWVIRGVDGQSQKLQSEGQPCANCGARFGVRSGRCVACGAVPSITPGGNARDELTTTARQLRKLLEKGAISEAQYNALATVISTELARHGAALTPLSPGGRGVGGVGAATPMSAVPSVGTKPGPGEVEAGSPFAPPKPASAPQVAYPYVASAESEVIDAVVVEEPAALPIPPLSPRGRGAGGEGAVAAPAARAGETPAPWDSPGPGVVPAKEVHPLDRPVAPPPPPQPSLPARTLADMLQSFMEESNIRWGEIVAALLIVVSSVGLVFSLRSTLQAIPYAPACLFALFTLAFHGAGLYTLRRWNLQAVSRVVLIISLLLVPLAISGAVVMSGSGQTQRPLTDPLFLLAIAIGTAAFGWVSFSASSELVGEARWRLAIGILLCSLSQIVIHRLPLAGLDFWRLNAVLALPLAGFLIATVGQLYSSSRRAKLARPRVVQTLLVLGTVTFAFLAPLLLILVRSEPRWPSIARLSPGLSLAAAAILAIGLLIHRRSLAKRLAAYQTAGTAILIFAGTLLLILVGFTWPDPELLVTVGLINCIVLVLLGVIAELPLLYAPAVACAALASVVGLHLAQGRFPEKGPTSLDLVQSLLMGSSSVALTALAALALGIGGWVFTNKRRDDGLMLLFSTAGLAVAALAITFFSGFVTVPDWPPLDRDLAAPMLLLYSAALLAAGALLSKSRPAAAVSAIPPQGATAIVAAGSFLLWTALVQALWLNQSCYDWLDSHGWLPDRPILVATLTHGIATAFASLGCLWVGAAKPQLGATRRDTTLPKTLAIGAAISLTAILPAILWVGSSGYRWHALFALLAAIGWTALAAGQRWRWAISGLQTMLALAGGLFVAGAWVGWTGSRELFVNEQHLLAQVILLGLGGVVWGVVRRTTSGSDVVRDLLHAPWPAVDQILLGLGAIALPLIAMAWTLPLVGWELGFDVAANALRDGPSPRAVLLGEGGRGWIALVVVLCSLLVALWERVNFPALVSLGIASFSAVWLAAEPFHSHAAAASAVRWAAGIYAIVWAAAFIARDQIQRAAKSQPWLRWARFNRELAGLEIGARPQDWFCAQPLLFGGLTILIITIVAVAQSTSGAQLRGPLDSSLLGRVGPTACYAAPLLALVAVLLGYAIRERQPAFAFGGSGVFQLAINLAFVLYVSNSPPQPQAVRAIEWLQWNSIGAGAYALVWLGLRRWIATKGHFPSRIMLDLQITAAGITAAALAVTAAWAIFSEPSALPAEIVPLAGRLSFIALGLLLAALAWLAWTGETTLRRAYLGDLLIGFLAAAIPLISAAAHAFDTGGQWIAYHTLAAGWMIVGALACACVVFRSAKAALPSPLVGEGPGVRGSAANNLRTRHELLPHHLAAASLAALVTLLAIRGTWSDPLQPWWSLAAALASFAIITALGLACRSQLYAYASTLLAGLAVILYWFAPVTRPWHVAVFGDMPAIAEALTLALLAAAAVWLWREVRAHRRQNQSFDTWFVGPRAHIATVVGVLPLYCLLRLGFAVFYNHPGWLNSPSGFPAYAAIAVVATIALGVLITAMFWDRLAFVSIPSLFVWGGIAWLLAIGVGSPWLPEIEHRVVAILAALALHVALTGQIWSYGANLSALGTKVGISDPIGGLTRTARWLPVISALLALLTCIVDLGFVLVIREDYLRVVAALGPAACAWGILCLAQEKRQSAFQLTALLMAGLSAIYLAWAQIAPDHTTALWMSRVFRLVMVLAALTFAYGLVLPRWLLTTGSWNDATRKAGYIAATAAIAAFVATLALEVALFRPGVNTLAVDDSQVAAVAVVLLFLIAGLVSLALLPGRDPLLLSETNRQAYVYAAQIIAALLFAHLYVCRPLWFDGVLRPYWPFIVMGLAFVGVGTGELFRRWNIRVLAEPLERTGALLPILPVIGMWVVGRADEAQILLVVGLLYLAISFTRKSWPAMVAAALAGNGALWALLVDYDFNFAGHPQFWLIPPAVSALLAAHVNRHRLRPEALTAIRYASTIVIYVSSTSEIFLRGIGDSLWPPMVLLILAVAGTLAGIALRVRAFLFLGTAFTLLALIAMVAHAARAIEHVWPWWVFGISVGIAILVLFGIFEKKRAEVLALIGRLKAWEL